MIWDRLPLQADAAAGKGWKQLNSSTNVYVQDAITNTVAITLTSGAVTGLTVGDVSYLNLGNGVNTATATANTTSLERIATVTT